MGCCVCTQSIRHFLFVFVCDKYDGITDWQAGNDSILHTHIISQPKTQKQKQLQLYSYSTQVYVKALTTSKTSERTYMYISANSQP